MRKIEHEMLAALNSDKDWGKGNTSVEGYPNRAIYLHGNCIARLECGELKIVKDTLTQYPTKTTVSRLKALGFNLCTTRGELMLNGKPLDHPNNVNHLVYRYH